MADFKVRFNEQPNFKANMGEVQVVTVGAPPYDGAYDVTPKTEAQTLATKDRRMVEDVTVQAIPYAEVKNTARGVTVTIA